jgi:hypothetical protein
MPTSATHTFAPGGLLPATPDPRNSTYSAKLKASTTFQQGSLLAELTATPGIFVPYVAGGSDGSQIPKAILKYALTTDANGGFSVGPFGGIRYDAPIYLHGDFRTDDLPQSGVGAIDATAITNQPAWHLLEGSVTKGIISLG